MSLTISCLVLKWNRGFGAYQLVFLMAMRCITTFVILYLIQTQAPGFNQIDRKEFAGSMAFIAMPGFISACCNFKFHTLVTFPMTCIAMWAEYRQTWTTEDDNLSCYLEPKAVAMNLTLNWSVLLLC